MAAPIPREASVFRGEHPFRCDSQAHVSEHCLAHAFSCVHADSAGQGHGRIRSVAAAKQPRFTAASHVVDDRTMPAEIDRCQRKSGFREI